MCVVIHTRSNSVQTAASSVFNRSEINDLQTPADCVCPFIMRVWPLSQYCKDRSRGDSYFNPYFTTHIAAILWLAPAAVTPRTGLVFRATVWRRFWRQMFSYTAKYFTHVPRERPSHQWRIHGRCGGCGRIPLSSDKNFLNVYILGMYDCKCLTTPGCRQCQKYVDSSLIIIIIHL